MVYFVTENCINVGDDMGAIIRSEALNRCYAVQGYRELPLDEKNKIYDRVVKEVEAEIVKAE